MKMHIWNASADNEKLIEQNAVTDDVSGIGNSGGERRDKCRITSEFTVYSMYVYRINLRKQSNQ